MIFYKLFLFHFIAFSVFFTFYLSESLKLNVFEYEFFSYCTSFVTIMKWTNSDVIIYKRHFHKIDRYRFYSLQYTEELNKIVAIKNIFCRTDLWSEAQVQKIVSLPRILEINLKRFTIITCVKHRNMRGFFTIQCRHG